MTSHRALRASTLALLVSWTLVGCASTRPATPVEADRLFSDEPLLEASPVPLGTGEASFYGPGFHGRTTASGGRFDQHELTAAHRTLEFGSRLRVTNLANGRTVVVTVTDRGPYVRGRVIDLSVKAARVLGFLDDGVARVRLERLS